MQISSYHPAMRSSASSFANAHRTTQNTQALTTGNVTTSNGAAQHTRHHHHAAPV